jgi:hypothetical protein
MRHTSSRRRHRRPSRESGFLGPMWANAIRLAHEIQARAGQRRVWWALPALALLAAAWIALSAWSPLAHAVPAAPDASDSAWHLAQQTTPRTQIRWRDTADQTEMTLVLAQSNGNPLGAFTFVIPGGDQVVVQRSGLVKVAAALSQLAPDAAFDSQQTVCTIGTLINASGQLPPLFRDFVGRPVVSATVGLTLHVGQGGLVAYAGMSLFLSSVSAGCSGPPQYQLMAGCDSSGTPAGCTAPQPPAQMVVQYTTALVAAVRSNNWGAVYGYNSQTVKEQYSQGDFTTAMQHAVSQVGRITSISTSSAPIEVQTDSSGQTYFTVAETITYDQGGSSHTQQVTSYYLLEDGNWHYWFSK